MPALPNKHNLWPGVAGSLMAHNSQSSFKDPYVVSHFQIQLTNGSGYDFKDPDLENGEIMQKNS